MNKRFEKIKTIPVCRVMCATCPFRRNSKYKYLANHLAESALTTASRICHSTGSNGLNRRTGKKSKICRGARNAQLHVMAGLGVIKEATDKAWDAKRKELGV